MRKLFMMMAFCTGLTACNSDKVQQAETTTQEDGVEVLYFHGKQRCATCVAIERETKAIIEEQFADEVKNGLLEFRIIDISKAENEAIADKYEITWSSLVVAKHENGAEQAENLTKFAFANARNHPETFRNELTKKINELLK